MRGAGCPPSGDSTAVLQGYAEAHSIHNHLTSVLFNKAKSPTGSRLGVGVEREKPTALERPPANRKATANNHTPNFRPTNAPAHPQLREPLRAGGYFCTVKVDESHTDRRLGNGMSGARYNLRVSATGHPLSTHISSFPASCSSPPPEQATDEEGLMSTLIFSATRRLVPTPSGQRHLLQIRLLHTSYSRIPCTRWRCALSGLSTSHAVILSARVRLRGIHIPSVLLPPVIFTGLLLGLWIWKCTMLVVFQNKIIYMPGLPPNARRETIADYSRLCWGIQWREETTKAVDGTRLGLAVATIQLPSREVSALRETEPRTRCYVYVLYFQGNASSLPPRLPDLSAVLHKVRTNDATIIPATDLIFVCLSYRGYWTSGGKPSERGIRLDAEAGVRWIVEDHRQRCLDGSGQPPVLLLWGQSIGSGVATNLAATGRLPDGLPIRGMILETPFTSIRALLSVLYPQRWLPYKYLWPFLRNHLDSLSNLDLVAAAAKKHGGVAPHIYILEAERDELVPKEHSEDLYAKCLALGIPVEKGAALAAFHQEAIVRSGGKTLAAQAILKLAKEAFENAN